MLNHETKPKIASKSNAGAGADRSSPRSKSHQTTADQLTQKNVESVLHLEEAIRAKANGGDKLADAITRFCGSMFFVWIHAVWYGVWIAVNMALPKDLRFDPFPFSLLTLVVSLEAIFLSTFLLISQNRQSVLDQRRAHLDLQIDLLAEQENTKMLELLEKIACKVGIDLGDDNTIKALAEAIKPEHLAKQIEKTIQRKNGNEGQRGAKKPAQG